jgi:hypothetical protein
MQKKWLDKIFQVLKNVNLKSRLSCILKTQCLIMRFMWRRGVLSAAKPTTKDELHCSPRHSGQKSATTGQQVKGKTITTAFLIVNS